MSGYQLQELIKVAANDPLEEQAACYNAIFRWVTQVATRVARCYAAEQVEAERKRLMEWVCSGCGMDWPCSFDHVAPQPGPITRAQYIAERGEAE